MALNQPADPDPESQPDPEKKRWAIEQMASLYLPQPGEPGKPDEESIHEGMVALARKRGLNQEDSKDLVLETAVAVQKRLIDKGPVKGSLAAYFAKAVLNRIEDHFRKIKNNEKLGVREVKTQDPEELDKRSGEPLATTSRGRALSPENQARLQACKIACDELPAHLREPYELKVYGQMRPKDIAATLGKAPGTIRVYLHQAQARVVAGTAELLREKEGNDDE